MPKQNSMADTAAFDPLERSKRLAPCLSFLLAFRTSISFDTHYISLESTSSSCSRTLSSMAMQRRRRQFERPLGSLNSVSQILTVSGKGNSWVSRSVIHRNA